MDEEPRRDEQGERYRPRLGQQPTGGKRGARTVALVVILVAAVVCIGLFLLWPVLMGGGMAGPG